MINVNAGFTLLEVLMSLMLFSLALLGVLSAVSKAIHQSREIYYFRQATILAENMVIYQQAHHGASAAYETSWRANIATTLPDGVGQLINRESDHQINIIWGQPSVNCTHQQIGVSGCVSFHIKS